MDNVAEDPKQQKLGGLIVSAFLRNNQGNCLISRQGLYERFKIDTDSKGKRLERKLDSLESDDIIRSIRTRDRSVFYLLFETLNRNPWILKSIERKDCLGQNDYVLIIPESKAFVSISQYDPNKEKPWRGRRPEFVKKVEQNDSEMG